MSRRSRMDGLNETISFFDALPTVAHEEMAVELGIVAREVLAAQQADVPKDTGALASSLSYRVDAEKLSATIGILGKKGKSRSKRRITYNFGDDFYGLIVEIGRRKQTVNVTRRVARTVRGFGKKRQVLYQQRSNRVRRRGPNKGTLIGSAYKMRVPRMAARPFVQQPLFQEIADRSLADFWSKAITRTGGR